MSANPELEAAAAKLERFALARHPAARAVAAGSLARSVEAGTPIADALAGMGASPELVAFVREAAPRDLPGVIDAVAGAIGRGADRARARRDAAFYPLALCASITLLGVAMLAGLAPAMRTLLRLTDGTAGSASATEAIVALGAAAFLLAFMGWTLSQGARAFPFAEAARREERARILSAAAAASSRGVALPKALAASAPLAPAGEVRDSALACAAALGRGEAPAPAGRDLFGDVGAALFAAASAKGAGDAALAALADAAEKDAEASLPFDTVRAEIASLLIAGAGLAIAAASFATLYAGSFR